MKNLQRFINFCGQDGMKNIILVTTMWGELNDPAVGERREKELKDSFWKEMLAHGCRTERFEGTCGSAWHIVGSLKDSDAAKFPRLNPNNEQRKVTESVDVYRGETFDEMEGTRGREEDGEYPLFERAGRWLNEKS